MYTMQKGYSQLRKGRYSEPGQIYLVTSVTRERCPVFSNFWSARTLIRILHREPCAELQTLAFVVMPDHVHWLLQLHSGELPVVMKRVKSLSARSLGGSLWQSGYHDRALRKEENLPEVARYIVANPLRAGLVDSVRQYPHWDAVWL